jgi:hypothetical protein
VNRVPLLIPIYIYILSNNFKLLNSDTMVLESHENGKQMPELSMLTILIEAAAAVKNNDGDKSIHGYMEGPRRVMSNESDEVDMAVLDSIGDTLLQHHQVLAITFDKRHQEQGAQVVPKEMMSDTNSDSPAEHPISEASKVMSISASVVPNPNEHRGNEGGQLGGPLGNIKQVTSGKSMWAQVKIDPFFYAVK